MSTGPKKGAEKAPASAAKKKPAASSRVEELKPEAAAGHDLYTAMQDRYGYRGTQRLLRAISAQRPTDRAARPASPGPASPSIARKPAPVPPAPRPRAPVAPRPMPKPVDAPKPAVEEAAIQTAPVVASFAGGAGSEDPPGGGPPARIARRETGDAPAPDAGHPAVRDALGRVGRGQPLRDVFPATMEARPDVHVHADGAADHAAKALHARAFTVGSDIFFARGEYRPGSDDGDRLLRHELTHVAQNARAVDVDASGPARVSKQDDAVEREARAAESGGVPAALTRGGPPVIARDEEKVDSAGYYDLFRVNLWPPVIEALCKTTLPPPADAYWLHGRDDAFVSSTLTPLSMTPYATVKATAAPGDLDAAIQRGRALTESDHGKGAKEYKPAVETELQALLLPRVNESLQRLAPQYLAAVYLATKPEMRVEHYEQKVPPLDDIVGSRPMDRYAIQGLGAGQLYVDFKSYEASGAAAQAGSQKKTKRKLAYAFEGAEARLIRVSDTNPTAEEAAYTLYGETTMAGSIIDAAPLFGFYPQLLTEEVFGDWQKFAGDKGKDVKRGDVPGTEDPAKAILEGPSGDEVALNQARKLKPSGAPKDQIVAAMRTSIELIQQIKLNTDGPLPSTWLAGGTMVRKLEQRAKDLEASTDPAAPLRWDAQTMAQKTILGHAATGATNVRTLWRSFAVMKTDDKGSGELVSVPDYLSKPIAEVARAYLGVAEVSDLVGVAADRASQADEKAQALPIALLEGMLMLVRQLLAGAGPGAGGGEDTLGVGEMSEREAKLRERLMAMRAQLLRDPSKVADLIKDIQSDVADLQDEASMAATLDALEKEQGWLRAHENTFIGTLTGKNLRYMQAEQKLSAWYFDKLLPIYFAYKHPNTRADARKRLKDLQKDGPALQKDMADIMESAQSEEEREHWIGFGAKIAALVAITIVTVGVGEWVAGGLLVSAGWGGTAAGTLGAIALSSGAEAAVFTGLTTAAFGKDPDKSLLQSFAENWLLFGAMKGLTVVAEAAVGAKVVTKTVGQGISVVGGLAGQTALSLAEADAKKKKETGKGLTQEEATAMVGEQLVVLVASALAMRYGPGKAFLEGAKARGQESPFFRQFETVDKARNNAIRAISALNRKTPVDQAKRVVEMDTNALRQEAELLKDMKAWAEDWAAKNPGKANILDIDPGAIGKLEDVTRMQIEVRERAALALMLKSQGGNLFHCGPGMLDEIVARYEKLGDNVTRDPEGKREAVVTNDKTGAWMRIVEETASEQGVPNATAKRLAELRQTLLSPEAQGAFDEVIRGAKSPEIALKQLEAMAASPEGLEAAMKAAAKVREVASPAQLKASEPVNAGWQWRWYLYDEASGAKFCTVAVDDSAANPSVGPHLTLTPKEAVLPDGTEVSLRARGFSWTDEALRLTMESYRAKFGKAPPDLSGLIAWDNLANFQWEFAKLRAAGVERQAAGDMAAAKISFGRARVRAGYGNLRADMNSFADVTLAAGAQENIGKTLHDVPGYVVIEATPSQGTGAAR